MEGRKRREMIMELLRQGEAPISGSQLARLVGVSRQVVVQDIALLRAEHQEILSTNKGYVLSCQLKTRETDQVRVFRVSHTEKETLDELYTIVDCGGRLLDVWVEHGIYGRVSAELRISSRLEAEEFIKALEHSKDQLFLTLTGGCHYHTVKAASQSHLDRIEEELRRKGYLA